MADEMEWMDNRYGSLAQAAARYPADTRAGREAARQIDGEARGLCLAVWQRYLAILGEGRMYTIGQAASRLLRSKQLPQFDFVAVDEAQDLPVKLVQLLLRLKKDSGFLLLAGDEGQKVYERDFSWRGVSESLGFVPPVLKLGDNMRNTWEIQRFASRLDLEGAEPRAAGASQESDSVRIVPVRSDADFAATISAFVRTGQSTAVITGGEHLGSLERELTARDYEVRRGIDDNMRQASIRPGVYLLTPP